MISTLNILNKMKTEIKYCESVEIGSMDNFDGIVVTVYFSLFDLKYQQPFSRDELEYSKYMDTIVDRFINEANYVFSNYGDEE